MNKILCTMCILTTFSMHCSEAESKEQKKSFTHLSRVVNHDGTSKRILVTIDDQGKTLKTTLTFAKDGKTPTHCDTSYNDLSRDDILRLTNLQHIHHTQLTIASLEKLNELAIKQYTEAVGSIECNSISRFASS